MTPQHPAAPEGEADARVALTQAEIKALLSVGRDEDAIAVVERIVAERLRVVIDEHNNEVRRRCDAEAAHAALVARVEALDRSGRMSFDHSDLRALLAGGGA